MAAAVLARRTLYREAQWARCSRIIPFRSTDSAPGRTSAWTIRWATAASGSTSGSFRAGARPQVLEDLFGSTGAVVVGRRTFDLGDKHWGDDPPFHRPVFVVTHRPQAMVTKRGGTTYTFVTDGLERAMAQARATAGDRDVVVLGGATIMQKYIRAGPLDELRFHVAHIILGGGTSFFGDVDPASFALERTRLSDAEGVTHLSVRVGTLG